MEKTKKKLNIKLNNVEKIEQLLQETYDLACEQANQIQQEINKIAGTTDINQLDIDGKEKYGKIMNNYISLHQKSIGQKFDIAKLLSEIVKHGGDVKGALDDTKNNTGTLDLKRLRELANNINTKGEDISKDYEINS